MNRILSRASAGLLFVVLIAVCVHAADRSKSLPTRYRHWLNQEVNYIIDSSERKNFLALGTDAERDSFIDAFWKIRNPDPNSTTNSYKEEHYRRLNYANEHFGTLALEDGWRTDRGHMYIVLGAPKQVMTYQLARNVRPMEIWFYQSATPALPPYFYLLFYKRSLGEDFTLYSPTQDGPARLVSTLEAMNDQQRSLDTLRKSLGDEVATIAVSLIPGDRVDLHSFEPDMTSDLLMSEIRGLPDNPLTQEQLNINRLQERVTTSILTGATAPEVSYGVFRDDHGEQTLSLLLKGRTADPQLIGESGSNKGLGYDVELRTAVLTAEGKPVYDQVDEMIGTVSETQAAIARQKKFGAETRMPLVPGKYTVVTTLTNTLNHVATRQRTSLEVPGPKNGAIGLSPLLAYTQPAGVPDPEGLMPFSASKVRFTPRGAQTVTIHQGEKLPLVFQLWLDPQTLSTHASEKIHVRYVFGAVTASHDAAVTEGEEVDPANHDAAGNLLTGHTVNTADLAPGTYRLVVGANWDGAQQTAYETMTVHVVSPLEQIDGWTAYGGVAPDTKAVDDLKRGLSAEAQGADAEAEKFYAKALTEGAGEVKPLEKLATLLARRNETEALAALSQKHVLEETAVAPKTLLLIAAAQRKSGNPKGVVHMLDAQIKLQPPSSDLYRAMADACEAAGDNGRAHDFRALAEQATEAAPTKN